MRQIFFCNPGFFYSGKKSVPKVKKKKEKRVRCDECEFTCENPAKLTVHKMSKHKADPESGTLQFTTVQYGTV